MLLTRIMAAAALAMGTGSVTGPAQAQPDRPGFARPAPIDPERDEVLVHIKGAANPSEPQWDRIVARYARLRDEQRDVLREVRREMLRERGERPAQRQAEKSGRSPRLDREMRESMERRARERLEPLARAFLGDVRAMLDEQQRKGFDECVADLDLSPQRARPENGPGDPGAGPAVGERAPAFELKDLDGRPVTLASMLGKPTVIEFGSYTCPIFRRKVDAIESLRREFDERVNWVLIYTREAHPTDGWVVQSNEGAGIRIPQHRSLEDRLQCAKLAAEKLPVTLTVVVDGMDDRVTSTFAGYPNRGYVLDAEGVVVSKQVWIEAAPTREALRKLLGKG